MTGTTPTHADTVPGDQGTPAEQGTPAGQGTWAVASTVEPRGYASSRDAHLKRLARIEGQIRGISRMVSQDAYCIDILTQTAAATRALQAVALGLLDDHLAHCVLNAARAGGEEQEAKLKEASQAIARLVRS